MKLVPIKVALAVLAVGALSAGCATRLEMGPGYYHYDSRLASASTAMQAPGAALPGQQMALEGIRSCATPQEHRGGEVVVDIDRQRKEATAAAKPQRRRRRSRVDEAHRLQQRVIGHRQTVGR